MTTEQPWKKRSRLMPGISRNQRRIMQREAEQRPARMVLVPPHEWPQVPIGASKPVEVWINNRYLAQVYQEDEGILRVSVGRTAIDASTGRWADNIPWDDLQDIKRQIGLGDSYAVEVYPREGDLVNVANLRHLWVLPRALPRVGWFSTRMCGAVS